MSRDALTQCAILATLLAVLVTLIAMLRFTVKRPVPNSVIDHVRCLELSTQWNHALLEQVAELSKQNAVLREALGFYAEPETWATSIDQEQSRASKDRGEMARLALCDQREMMAHLNRASTLATHGQE
jgi:hypothetical protein